MSTSLQKKEIPEVVKQANEISRAMYDLGPYARKLVAVAMSLMSPEEGKYTVSFKATEFLDAIGLEYRKQGTKTKDRIKAAVRECLNSHIEIERDNGDWEGYTWFTESKLQNFKFEWDWGWDKITMTFNPKLGDIIKAFKIGYSKINLVDLGKLQSRYAIRFYEMAISLAGFAGQDGNRRGEWYFEMSLDDIRSRFMLEKKRYKVTKDFRVNVIDKPIEEINSSGIGLRITPEYIRKGKRLIGARFNCRYVKRGEPVPTQPATETGHEDDKLRKAFPERFDQLKTEEWDRLKKAPPLPFYGENLSLQELHAEGKAMLRLREEHPDFFKTKKEKKNAQL
jgi:plasmid replication initiation protein